MTKKINNHFVNLIKTPSHRTSQFLSLKNCKEFARTYFATCITIGKENKGKLLFYDFAEKGSLLIAGTTATGKTILPKLNSNKFVL